jgi:hypothetical protein
VEVAAGVIETGDERPHEAGEEQAWSESYYFAWFSPGASGLARIATRPNEGTQDLIVVAWDEERKPVVASASREQRVNDEVLSVGGAVATCEEPLRRWRLRFEGEVSLDLRFEALGPPASTQVRRRGSEGGRTIPRHFEQPVRVSGSVDGAPFEGLGFRDKSWGVRDWSKPNMWRWFALPFGPDLSINALAIEIGGVESRGGWCMRHGEVLPVTGLELDTVYEPDGLTQRSLRMAVEVAGDETIEIDGEVLAVAPLQPGGGTLVNEGLTRWRTGARETLGIAEYLHQVGGTGAPPRTRAGLSPAWLTRVLGARVLAVDAAPLGDGHVADSFRLSLDYEASPTAPSSIVAKIAASDETSRAGAAAGLSYVREVRFYEELAATVGIRVPGCHHAELTDDGGFALLLEDVSPAREVGQIEGCSPADAAHAMEQAALLHAPRWGDRSLEQLPWLHLAGSTARLLAKRLPACWEGFRARYGDRLDDDVAALCERVMPRLPELWAREPAARTIVHGDYRTDNMLFDAHGGRDPLVVVDWQTPSLRAGPADVAFFLGNSMTVEDRRAAERDLVRSYWDALVAGGVEGYPFERCFDEYRLASLDGMSMTVLSAMIVRRSEHMDDIAVATVTRSARIALDNEAEELLR